MIKITFVVHSIWRTSIRKNRCLKIKCVLVFPLVYQRDRRSTHQTLLRLFIFSEYFVSFFNKVIEFIFRIYLFTKQSNREAQNHHFWSIQQSFYEISRVVGILRVSSIKTLPFWLIESLALLNWVLCQLLSDTILQYWLDYFMIQISQDEVMKR